ncbi:MAG: hypothetical protein ACOY5U_09415 [Pseudomonadota bacterium]
MAEPTPIDWDDDEDVVVRKQMPIRVFLNTSGNVVIQQENEDPHEDDPLIVIRPEWVRVVADALLRWEDPE